ncbi:MAG: hypothetical protein MUF54_22350 [Polyangiaceae bacterium]|nr:hypothetical protein [Polyangiaceae bacterium]
MRWHLSQQPSHILLYTTVATARSTIGMPVLIPGDQYSVQHGLWSVGHGHRSPRRTSSRHTTVAVLKSGMTELHNNLPDKDLLIAEAGAFFADGEDLEHATNPHGQKLFLIYCLVKSSRGAQNFMPQYREVA